MGKGDKKSRRGKLWAGTFGKKRPHKAKKKATATTAESTPKPSSK